MIQLQKFFHVKVYMYPFINIPSKDKNTHTKKKKAHRYREQSGGYQCWGGCKDGWNMGRVLNGTDLQL